MHKHPYCIQISALYVAWFLSYRQINKFSSQKSLFSNVFLCVNLESLDLGSPKLTHETLLLILMLSPNFSFLDLDVCWLFANQSSSAKIREQQQRYYAFTQSFNKAVEAPITTANSKKIKY